MNKATISGAIAKTWLNKRALVIARNFIGVIEVRDVSYRLATIRLLKQR